VNEVNEAHRGIRRTKIVCTIGPASDGPDKIAALIDAGANVARLNMSHGTSEEHRARVGTIRRVAAEKRVPIAILADLAGPKVRLGEMEREVTLRTGDIFRISRERATGDATRASTNHPALVDEVPVGAPILIDDGLVQLRVEDKTRDELLLRVLVGGPVDSRKGLAVPQASLSLEVISEKDKADLALALALEADWIAMSFVRTGDDVRRLRDLMGERSTPVIAKIERAQAVGAIDDILAAADGVMVARGDLGVDLPSQDVPVIQKQLIAKALSAGKPVITATQMLDSMIRNPRPTRAEASDVANAVFDGSDALMLSGETAIGAYPVESVVMMAGIIDRAEQAPGLGVPERCAGGRKGSITDAISSATCSMAQDLNAAAIVTSTESGHTARAVARHRPHVPIVAVTTSERVMRQLVLSNGVLPVKVKRSTNIDDMLDRAAGAAAQLGFVRRGDVLIITAGVLVNRPGTTNMIKVHRLE